MLTRKRKHEAIKRTKMSIMITVCSVIVKFLPKNLKMFNSLIQVCHNFRKIAFEVISEIQAESFLWEFWQKKQQYMKQLRWNNDSPVWDTLLNHCCNLHTLIVERLREDDSVLDITSKSLIYLRVSCGQTKAFILNTPNLHTLHIWRLQATKVVVIDAHNLRKLITYDFSKVSSLFHLPFEDFTFSDNFLDCNFLPTTLLRLQICRCSHLENISSVSKLVSLKDFHLNSATCNHTGFPICEVINLQLPSSIEILRFSNLNILDLSFMSNLVYLKEIHLKCCHTLQNIDALFRFKQLTTVRISECSNIDLETIDALTSKNK